MICEAQSAAGRRRPSPLIALLVAAMVTLALLPVAHAAQAPPASRAQAQQSLRAGSALYRRGDYQGALAKFKEAQALYPSPKLHFNIGQAYRQMGHKAAAVESFERFLAEAPDAAATPRREAERWLTRLRPTVAFLRVVAGSGAKISVDGETRGVAPLSRPIPIEPGAHEAAVVLSSSTAPITRKLEIGPGQTVDWEVPAAEQTASALAPAALAAAAASSTVSADDPAAPSLPSAEAPAAAVPPVALSASPEVDQDEDQGWRRWWPWVAVAGAVVVGATAAALLVTRDGPLPSGSLGNADGRRGN